jgi:predicted transposase YdaD
MTYAQELVAEGEARGKVKGRIEERVKMIEGLLQEGVEGSVIERVSGVNEAQFQALKQELEAHREDLRDG